MTAPLTRQQEAFAQEVAKGADLTSAFRVAYPPKKAGRTEKTEWEEASKVAANPKVSTRIKTLRDKAAEVAVLDAAAILRELGKLALADVKDLLDSKGRVRLPHELPAALRASVKSFKLDDMGRAEYTFWDKNVAIQSAMKNLGLFEKDNAQKPPALPSEIRLVPLQPAPRNDAAEAGKDGA